MDALRRSHTCSIALAVGACLVLAAPTAEAGHRNLCWQGPPDGADCQGKLGTYMADPAITAIDVLYYRWYSRAYSDRLVRAVRAGKRVRVVVDRLSYLAGHGSAEVDYVASKGVPVRITRHAGSTHAKTTMLYGVNGVGQAVVATYHPGANPNIWEMHFAVQSARVTARFKDWFDRAWANAYNPVSNPAGAYYLFKPMAFEPEPVATCYAAPVAPPADDPVFNLCLTGDEDCMSGRLVPSLDAEMSSLDIAVYNLTNPAVRDSLIRFVRSGRPLRMITDRRRLDEDPGFRPALRQIREAAVYGNVWFKAQNSASLPRMHMKLTVGSTWASWGSANYTRQSRAAPRGCSTSEYHDQTVMVVKDKALRDAASDRFEALWSYGAFVPFRP
jgi:hypothetical protein